MKAKYLGLLILAGLFLAGCQSAPTPAPKPSISVAYPSEPDLGDVPTLMALDLLRSQGYEVRETFFAEPPLAVEALSRGDAQFSFGSMETHWSATEKGAKIVTIMEQLRDTWVLMASNEISQCSDINGKKLAVSSPGSGSAALVRAYITKNCPGTEPELMLISGSSNRAAALLAGEVDVTPVELPDVEELLKEAPDKVHVMVTFAEDLPDVMVTGVHANLEFAEANPEVVKDFLNALLTVYKQNEADSAALVRKAAEVLKAEPAEIEPIVKTHLDFHAWPPDGGLTEARVTSTLDFYVANEDLEQGITASDVANWDYLQIALGGK
jgi:NitT/TauT family transport system substrate-binding protein